MVLAEIITLVIFTIILSKSASLVVENAARLARFFGISQLAVGMLLIAVSTSLPELSVSVISSASNEGSIAAGNVFGSNIANILIVLGLGAFLFGFRVSRETLPDLGLVLLLTTMISVYILLHTQLFGSALSLYEGVLLLLIAVWYGWRLFSKKGKIEDSGGEPKPTKQEGLRAFLIFFGGVVAVLVSSSFVVDSAVKVADLLGLAKSFIGATVIALGTSLPELSIDLQAIRKKRFGLALGDAIGSNMANLTLVLGAAASISPIIVSLNVFSAALLFAVVANMVFFYFAAVKARLGRNEGIAMLAIYAIYIISIFYLQISESSSVA